MGGRRGIHEIKAPMFFVQVQVVLDTSQYVGYISRNKRGIGCKCATKTRLSRCESPVRCASEVILGMILVILPTTNNT